MTDVLQSKRNTELHGNGEGSHNSSHSQQGIGGGVNGSDLGAEHALVAILTRIAEAVDRNNQHLGELATRVQTCEGQLQSLIPGVSELDKSLTQLADEIRLQRTADEQVVLHTAMGLVQMIDRQSSEITEAEQGVLAFSVVEECREVDRLDATNMLLRLGFEEMTIMRGSPVDPRIHDIDRIRPSVHANKYGRVVSVRKRGWRRRRDGHILRAPLVEVWGPQAAVA